VSLLDRIAFSVESWLDALLNRASNPAAELDYSYEQLRDQLQEFNRGIAELTTQKKHLELHRERLDPRSKSTTSRSARPSDRSATTGTELEETTD
jgi:phage shock protein A